MPTDMSYRYLGRTGMRVSELCLGSMTFGRETDEDESNRILNRFAEAGGNFIDTANVYMRGRTEEILGRWIETQKRDDLVIATKVRFPMGEGPNDTGLSRKQILRSVEASLRRLGTDYIDLYQVHCWDRGTDLGEYLRTLDDLVRRGLVRFIGASNVTGWQLQKAVDRQRAEGFEPFRSIQPQYSLLARGAEWEVLPVAINEGIGVIPWSPLKGGWLSGKYYRGMEGPPPGTRVEQAEKEGWFEKWDNMDNEQTWTVLDALHAASKQTGRHAVEVSLRWLLDRPGVTAPIVGVRTMDHLETALRALEWEMDPAVRDSLDAASALPAIYPYDFVEWAQAGR